MSEASGESGKFRPIPIEKRKGVVPENTPSRFWKLASKLGLASFIASAGITTGAVLDRNPPVVEDALNSLPGVVQKTGEAGEAVKDVGVGVAQKVDERYKTLIRDIQTGSPEKIGK